MDVDDILKSIDAFKNRTIYRRLTPALIVSLSDDVVEQVILDFVIQQWRDEPAREYEIVAALPEAIRDVYTSRVLDDEVQNGGCNQYFWNSSGQFAMDAIEALIRMEAHRHAEALAGAIKPLFANGEAWAEFRKRNSFEAFSESYAELTFDESDRLFYEAGNLSVMRLQYIRSRGEAFACG